MAINSDAVIAGFVIESISGSWDVGFSSVSSGMNARQRLFAESADVRLRPCPYQACVQCGACGVCRDFHGDHYGGCTELTCPARWYHAIRDWWRRTQARLRDTDFMPPWYC
jgi:hypothetical protein